MLLALTCTKLSGFSFSVEVVYTLDQLCNQGTLFSFYQHFSHNKMHIWHEFNAPDKAKRKCRMP